MDWLKLVDDQLYSRKQLRKLGLDFSSMTYIRWQQAGLEYVKAPGLSSRVLYSGAALRRFFKR
jgi:hypothetical protein